MPYSKRMTRAANMMARAGLELTVEQRREVIARVQHFVDLGNRLFNLENQPLIAPSVDFTLTGTTAATASGGLRGSLNFNPALTVREWDETINDTVPHEVAHLFETYIRYIRSLADGRTYKRDSAHGEGWRRVMRAFRVDPDKSKKHNMDVRDLKQHKTLTRIPYGCPCGKTFLFSMKKHNRVLRGYPRTCKVCRGTCTQIDGVAPVVRRSGTPIPPVTQLRIQLNIPQRVVPQQNGVGTKLVQSRAVLSRVRPTNRQDAISLLVREVGMTPAGASTYFNKLRQELAL